MLPLAIDWSPELILALAGLATAIGGIATSITGVIMNRRAMRDETTHELEDKLRKTRAEAEKYAEELHELRMKELSDED
jgi:uncharacterized membrane protein